MLMMMLPWLPCLCSRTSICASRARSSGNSCPTTAFNHPALNPGEKTCSDQGEELVSGPPAAVQCDTVRRNGSNVTKSLAIPGRIFWFLVKHVHVFCVCIHLHSL